VYGKEPNDFFASEIANITPGKLLLPGEGEGRNAVFAARQGWKVDAFDQSRVASEKALQYSRESGVRINYQVSGIEAFHFLPNYYNAAGLIYLHASPAERRELHHLVIKSLKPGGTIILEGFHTSQLGNNSGGPPVLEMLFDEEILHNDFKDLNTVKLEVKSIKLDEGSLHQGDARVIQYIGRK
jgi:2-polyprenyl-3-methyl-5-hydroxy-6-metoxy-1,4-benzoquinol methylase